MELVQKLHQRDGRTPAGTGEVLVGGRVDFAVLLQVGNDALSQVFDGGLVEPQGARGADEVSAALEVGDEMDAYERLVAVYVDSAVDPETRRLEIRTV